MVRWVGFKSTTLDVEHGERVEGRSAYTFARLFRMAADVMLAFSDKPLWLTVKFGFTLSLLSFVYVAWTILRAVRQESPLMGWSSLIVSVWFFSGIIIMVLGIVGIYIGKTFDQVKGRPLYVLRETTDDRDA